MRASSRGSVLIIVLWVAFGLVSIALYFADSMSAELRASDNQVCGEAADQAIEGASRYVNFILTNDATNGVIPDLTQYKAAAVPVNDAEFWIIGRNPTGTSTDPYFSLIDEASKLNLNYAGTNVLLNLPNMTPDFAQAIVDWRNTNGPGLSSLNYSLLGYLPKSAPFETVDELRLVYGSDMDLLVGEDINQNGVLDENEVDANHNGQADPGLFEYCTVFTREPNMHSDGSMLTNVTDRAAIQALLQSQFGAARANQIMARFVIRVQGPRGERSTTRQVTVNNLLQFYLQSGMTSKEFEQIANSITVGNAPYTYGRVNINTASATVLSCLPGMDVGTAQQLVNYRNQNPNNLGSIAWIVDALGAGNTAVQSLAQGDYITTHSYQFTADIAALGPHGRGYRRTRFVFDLSTGTVRIVYRQDLSRLGWALGKTVRLAMLGNVPK